MCSSIAEICRNTTVSYYSSAEVEFNAFSAHLSNDGGTAIGFIEKEVWC